MPCAFLITIFIHWSHRLRNLSVNTIHHVVHTPNIQITLCHKNCYQSSQANVKVRYFDLQEKFTLVSSNSYMQFPHNMRN